MSEQLIKRFFTKKLLEWNRTSNKREMPWKGEKDPYKIWLSEIILQQTRVEQGLGYYQRFVAQFPTVDLLAHASQEEVFKLWEGLGYYTRCKNLIATANILTHELKGIFPNTYEGILSLKGIGPYTAAAISSFAFNLPYAVVDGNVFRVLSRYFGINMPIDTPAGKSLFTQLATELLDKNEPGIYNQALMDFGAVICKPQVPFCKQCPLNKNCVAFLQNKVSLFPVKEKTIAKRTRWFYYVVVTAGDRVLIKKRTQKDIWENLYEFMLIEKPASASVDEILSSLTGLMPGAHPYKVETISNTYKQVLTHQTIYGQFIRIKIKSARSIKDYETVNWQDLNRFPFPKFISNYLKDKSVSLNLF